MRILVTGANGFVGRHLIDDLLKHNHEVILTDRSGGVSSSNHPVLKLDVTDINSCEAALKTSNPDAIIHLAGIAQSVGQTQEVLEQVNVEGTLNLARSTIKLLSSRNGIPIPFLFVSTAFVYGGDLLNGTHQVSETFSTIPRGAYGQSKLAAELKLKSLNLSLLNLYIARPFNHIGAGQHSSFVVPGICGRIQKAAPNSEIETGNMDAWRDFTDVRDVVRAYRLIIEKQPIEKTFVIGSGQAVSIQTVFDKLNQLSGKNLHQKLSDELKRNEGTAALIADISLAKRVLNWSPEISLDESLKAAWNEYK